MIQENNYLLKNNTLLIITTCLNVKTAKDKLIKLKNKVLFAHLIPSALIPSVLISKFIYLLQLLIHLNRNSNKCHYLNR